MKPMRPLPTLRSATLTLAALAAQAQPAVPDPQALQAAPELPLAVGIDEQLGRSVPLDLRLRDEAGNPVALGALLGKPTVLTLNYFRCAALCTPQLNGVVDVLNRTQAVPGRDFQVLTVSFDERDTAEIAAHKRANYLRELKRPFPPSAWRFLTGDARSTRALADAVGFRFQRRGEDYNHPAALIVLSPQGKVTRYLYGTAYLPADLHQAALEAAKGETRPTVPQWLSICYSYDPESRQMVVSFTRVAVVLVVAAAAVFAAVLIFRARPGGRGGRADT